MIFLLALLLAQEVVSSGSEGYTPPAAIPSPLLLAGRIDPRAGGTGLRPRHPFPEPGIRAQRGEVRFGLRHRIPRERGESPYRDHTFLDRALHHRPVLGGQGVPPL